MALILSPAGTKEALVAAVQNGADEVYLGLSDFNARASAENFTLETLAEWVRYAHVRGVKIHVTLNTLLHDDELEKALDLAKSADNLGVDAFIVQDLGLARRLAGNVNAALHASTQLTVYNVEGVRSLRELGFSRAVLARELPLREIAEIAGAGIMETEVFCHGALCMSYSGQCMLSFASGSGRSGNRGTCSQPCRLKYSSGLSPKYSNLLSPSDLSSLEYLNELCATGVTSLKIEGRLKSPEYVAAVTRAYRRKIDNPNLDVSEELDDLRTIFSRGGFSSGHQLGKMPVSAVTKSYAGRTGLIIGKTLGPLTPVKGKVPTFRAQALLDKKLNVNDGISFLGYPSNGGIVNKIDNVGHGRTSLLVSGTIPENNPENLVIYKTLDCQLSGELRPTYSPAANFRKVNVSADFTLGKSGGKLIFTDPEGRSSTVEFLSGDHPALPEDETRSTTEKTAQAGGKSFSAVDAENIIRATGNTPFTVTKCDFHIENDAFITFSELKKLRREAVEKLTLLREARIK